MRHHREPGCLGCRHWSGGSSLNEFYPWKRGFGLRGGKGCLQELSL
jgi:hypothetical protein